MYYIYIIRTKNNTLYTGITTNVERRLNEHRGIKSNGAKYTRSNPPLEIASLWSCNTRSDALKLEAKIKKLNRQQKDLLVLGYDSPLCDTYCRVCVKKYNEVIE